MGKRGGEGIGLTVFVEREIPSHKVYLVFGREVENSNSNSLHEDRMRKEKQGLGKAKQSAKLCWIVFYTSH